LQSIGAKLRLREFFAPALDESFGNAVLSNSSEFLKITINLDDKKEKRSCVAVLLQDCPVKVVYLVHLDHLSEDDRLKQLDILLKWIKTGDNSDKPHIIMGDFNSLTEDDYTEERKKQITAERKTANVETLRYDVIKQLQMDYINIHKEKHPQDKDDKVSTCTYKTRVDYIWLSKNHKAILDFSNSSVFMELEGASDHFPIVAELVFKLDNKQKETM